MSKNDGGERMSKLFFSGRPISQKHMADALITAVVKRARGGDVDAVRWLEERGFIDRIEAPSD